MATYLFGRCRRMVRGVTVAGFASALAVMGVGLVGPNVASATSTVIGTAATYPVDVAVDEAGNVYTANYDAGSVTKITPTGQASVLRDVGRHPRAVTVDSSGNVLVALEDERDLAKITPTGQLTTLKAPEGKDPDSDNAVAVTTGADGSVYASYSWGGVVKFLSNGSSAYLGDTGSWPSDIEVDAAGNVFTADDHGITRITPEGKSTVFASQNSYRRPGALALDGSGNVYASSTSIDDSPSNLAKAGYVMKYSPSGKGTRVGYTGRNPIGIAVDRAGNVYTANSSFGTVTRISPLGRTTVVATGLGGISRLAMDKAGALFTANIENRIFKITPTAVPALKQTPRLGACATAGIPRTLPAGRAVTLRMDPNIGDNCGNNAFASTYQRIAVKVTPAKASQKKSYSLYCLYQGQKLKPQASSPHGSGYVVCQYGQLTVRAAKKGMRASITWYAPATPEFSAYKVTKTYKT